VLAGRVEVMVSVSVIAGRVVVTTTVVVGPVTDLVVVEVSVVGVVTVWVVVS